MIDTLEQHFPTELAQRILQYHSHPIADIVRDLINKRKPYGMLELLQFIHYVQWNSRMESLLQAPPKTRCSRKHYGCSCRICMEIRETRFSQPN